MPIDTHTLAVMSWLAMTSPDLHGVVKKPQKPSTWPMVKCGVSKRHVRVETERTLGPKMRSGVRMRLSHLRYVTLADPIPIKAHLETYSCTTAGQGTAWAGGRRVTPVTEDPTPRLPERRQPPQGVFYV